MAKCHVQLTGPEAERWRDQVALLVREMQTQSLDHACTELSIDADGGRGRLTFTTADGRTAARELLDPVELVPTVQALSVRGDDPEAIVPSESTQGSPEPREPALVTPPRTDSARLPPRDAPAPAQRPLFGARACVRAGANQLLSPCLQFSAALPVGHWELGLLGRYEIRYFDLAAERSASPNASAIAFGLALGRREQLRDTVLTGGVAGLVAGLRDGQGNDDSDDVESRVAGYVGVTWPAHGRVALHADTMLEWVPYSRGRSRTNAAGDYSLPWWALTSSLGVEIR